MAQSSLFSGYVMFISCLVFIFGALLIGFGSMQMLADDPPYEFTHIDFSEKTFGGGVIAIGVVTLLFSFLGCAVVKWRSCLVTTPYAILSFLLCIAAFIVGGVMMGYGKSYLVKAQQTYCEEFNMDQQYREAVDHWVCSDTCPCPAGANDTIKNYWTGLNSTVLAESMRYKDRFALYQNIDWVNDWDYHQDEADHTPLVWTTDED